MQEIVEATTKGEVAYLRMSIPDAVELFQRLDESPSLNARGRLSIEKRVRDALWRAPSLVRAVKDAELKEPWWPDDI